MFNTNVSSQKLRSPLLEALRLESFKAKSRGNGNRRRKKMVAALILTSLVDAFSIMLLYLLVQNTGNGSTLELQNATRLPVATEATALHEGTLIRIEGNHYFLGEQPIEEVALASKLQEIRAGQIAAQNSHVGNSSVANENNEPALIVQADRDAEFARLAAVIRAGSVSGFHNFKFAVLQGEDR